MSKYFTYGASSAWLFYLTVLYPRHIAHSGKPMPRLDKSATAGIVPWSHRLLSDCKPLLFKANHSLSAPLPPTRAHHVGSYRVHLRGHFISQWEKGPWPTAQLRELRDWSNLMCRQDLYVVVHDKVYDATKFVDEHPYASPPQSRCFGSLCPYQQDLKS